MGKEERTLEEDESLYPLAAAPEAYRQRSGLSSRESEGERRRGEVAMDIFGGGREGREEGGRLLLLEGRKETRRLLKRKRGGKGDDLPSPDQERMKSEEFLDRKEFSDANSRD